MILDIDKNVIKLSFLTAYTSSFRRVEIELKNNKALLRVQTLGHRMQKKSALSQYAVTTSQTLYSVFHRLYSQELQSAICYERSDFLRCSFVCSSW